MNRWSEYLQNEYCPEQETGDVYRGSGRESERGQSDLSLNNNRTVGGSVFPRLQLLRSKPTRESKEPSFLDGFISCVIIKFNQRRLGNPKYPSLSPLFTNHSLTLVSRSSGSFLCLSKVSRVRDGSTIRDGGIRGFRGWGGLQTSYL